MFFSWGDTHTRHFTFLTQFFLCHIIAIFTFEMKIYFLFFNWTWWRINYREQIYSSWLIFTWFFIYSNSLNLFILMIQIIWSAFDFTSGSEGFNFWVRETRHHQTLQELNLELWGWGQRGRVAGKAHIPKLWVQEKQSQTETFEI